MLIVLAVPTSYRLANQVYFILSVDHRDLHSFPTRRSSDLRAGARVQLLQRDHLGCVLTLGRDRPRGDRKSTRLNSSHTVISYAVFCLKKKNKRKPSQLNSNSVIISERRNIALEQCTSPRLI